ncbi:helix-turn-helix domain-containing protein [Enterococcus crotali]
MKYLDFLDDDDKEKAQLLTTLQLYNEQFLSKKKLLELTGLSKFLLERYLTELNKEYPQLRISEEYYDEIAFQPISNEIIQELQYRYAERSPKFRFFIEVLVEEKSIKKFQAEQHIAKTTLYQIRTKVISSLKKVGLSIQKNKLIGPEARVRSVIFDIISYFYFGERYPFTHSEQKIQQLLQQLVSYFNLDLTFLQKRKLALFLQIMQSRRLNHHDLQENFCTVGAKTQQQFASQLAMLKKVLQSSIPTSVEEESHYILLFLFVSDMFDCDLSFNDDLLAETKNTAKQLVTQLSDAFQLTQKQEKYLYHSFLKKILGLSIFRQNYTTFVDISAYSYFSEVYNPLHRLVLRFIRKNHYCLSLNLSKNEQAKLYYDFMFSILAFLEPSQFGNPITIYIDFSHGNAYTEYISQSLQRFRDLNIVIQKRFNNTTQLSISDYKITELTCPQIIWKQPPSPSDWAKFADLVVELREVENEKFEMF